MEGNSGRFLAFCAGIGAGYAFGVVTGRWLSYQSDVQASSALLGSLQALSTEISQLRQTISGVAPQLLGGRRSSVQSRRTGSVARKEGGTESEREDDDIFYDLKSEASVEEQLELTSGNEQLDGFLEEVDSSLSEALTDCEKCMKVLEELSYKITTYPNHVGVLWRLAVAFHHRSSFYKQEGDTAKELELLQDGAVRVQQALELDGDCWQAHKWMAILTGAVALHTGIQEKITRGHKFKEHIDRAIQLKPDDYSSHHLLGRWQFEVSNLSWLERKAASTLFATPPTATFEEALESFSKAEELKPNTWKSNQLWLAKCHLKLYQNDIAVEWMVKAWALESKTTEDSEATTELVKLLQQHSPATLQ